jgi:DNA-binding transcriptional LysR family regulator
MIQLMSTFVAVVEAGSFSEAGRRMDQPKSAVSRRVGELEQHLGVRLLQRTTRVVRPTDAGLDYYRRCVKILADLEEANQLVRQDQATPSGKLRVQLPIEFGMHVLGRFLIEFVRLHPEVSVELELSNRQADMIEEQLDLAIRIGAMPDSTLISRKVLSIHRGFFASPLYLERRGEPRSTDELEHHDCLRFLTGYDRGEWALTGPGGGATVFRPKGPVLANNLTVLREAAASGLGIAALPHVFCREAVEAGQLRQIMRDWVAEDFEVFILYPSREHLPAKVRSFLDFFDQRVGELSRWANTPLHIIAPPLWEDSRSETRGPAA